MKRAHGFIYQHCEPEVKKTITEDPVKDNRQATTPI